jgi:tetratricopeptide (TPR) repeat protein
VCDPCNVAAKARVLRTRERQKERQHNIIAAHAHEAAGDAAMERFAYVEAPAQFEHALAQNCTHEDEARLCEKIGLAIFYSARPDLATPWFERALEQCLATESLNGKVPYIMSYLIRQHWLESRTENDLTYAERARELAICAIGMPQQGVEGNEALIYPFDALVVNKLVLLGRYEEAARFFVECECGNEERGVGALYLAQRAILHATKGAATEAFADFDRAVEIARDRPDGYMTTVCWDDHANWAMALGRLDIARACRERALFVARERRIAWRIPYLTLRFANMLVTAGDYEHARDLVADAMTHDTETPILRVLKAIVAVELAHAIGDTGLLKRTLDDEVLEHAFRSGEPQRILSYRHMRR